MNNEESTIYGTAEEQSKNNQQEKNAGKGWQQVTIGGVTGILMGAAATYAVNALAGETANNDEPDNTTTDGTQSHVGTNGLHVAEVDQNLPFGEAFAAARAEVGPGGVFHWHGNIYNTYTAQEWNSMTDGEHQQFAQQVQPEIQPGEVRTGQQDVAQQPQHKPVVDDTDKPEKPTPPKDDTDDEPEVHFLGVEQIQRENGETMNVGYMTIDDQDVALVDLDDNMVFDVALSDRNQNGKFDDNEIFDVSDRQMSVTDFALASAMEEGRDSTAQPEVASQSPQDQMAEDMPDYMNDADVQSI